MASLSSVKVSCRLEYFLSSESKFVASQPLDLLLHRGTVSALLAHVELAQAVHDERSATRRDSLRNEM